SRHASRPGDNTRGANDGKADAATGGRRPASRVAGDLLCQPRDPLQGGPRLPARHADLGGNELLANPGGDDAAQFARDRVAELAHGFRPRAMENHVIGEGLEPGAFAYREIADRPVRTAQHVFATGYAMDASLERLGGLIERT